MQVLRLGTPNLAVRVHICDWLQNHVTILSLVAVKTIHDNSHSLSIVKEKVLKFIAHSRGHILKNAQLKQVDAAVTLKSVRDGSL